MNGPPFLFVVGALFAVAAHTALLLGAAIPSWLLMACVLVGVYVTRLRLPALGAMPGLVLLAGAAAVAYGCLATTDRIWDGFTTWTASARWLAVDGTLNQPWFADPDAARVGRGYPLLQPMLLAQTMPWLGERGGRLLFVVFWLALPLTAVDALRRLGASLATRNVAALGLALVPLFLEGGPAGADSGYADLLVTVVTLGTAAAIVTNDARYAFAAALLLPLTKAEGTVWLLLLLAVAAIAPRPKAAIGAALGGALGLLLWAPIQSSLVEAQVTLGALLRPLVPIALGLGLLALRRLGPAATLGGLMAAAAAMVAFGGLDDAHLGRTLRDVRQLGLHLDGLPAVLARTGFELVSVREVGFTFLALVAGLWAVRKHGWPRHVRPLLAAMGLGIAAVMVFVLTRPPQSLDSFLRQGIGRYLAHWLGVAWLCVGLLRERLQETSR